MPRLSNPQIALGALGGLGGGTEGHAGGMAGPFQTLSAMMGLKEQRMKMEDRQRDQEDELAIRDTMQSYSTPDEAVGALYKAGRHTAAAKLGKSVYEQRKTEDEETEKRLKNVHSRMEMATQIAQGMTDETSFQNGRKAIGSLLEPVFGNAVYDQMGTTYDPERMKAVIAYGTSRGDELKRQQDAVTNAREANRLFNDVANQNITNEKAKAEMQTIHNNMASALLSTANSPEQWDGYMKKLHSRGVPDEILSTYGTWIGEASKQHALDLGQTSQQRITTEHQAKADDLAERRVTALEGRYDYLNNRPYDSTGGGAGRGPSATRVSEVRQKHDEAFDKIQDEIDTGILSDPVKIATRKLRTENNYRTQIGMPTLEDAAKAAQARGDAAGLKKVSDEYLSLTGKPLMPAPTQPTTAAPAAGASGAVSVPMADALARRKQYRELVAAKNAATNLSAKAAIDRQIKALGLGK